MRIDNEGVKGWYFMMISLRHVCIYVNNNKKTEQFYTKVFHMKSICSQSVVEEPLLDDLLHQKSSKVYISKLSTSNGAQQQLSGMFELIKAISLSSNSLSYESNMFDKDISPIAIGVDNINMTAYDVIMAGGKI